MYARRVLGDRSDTAEDVVQEAYLRLLGLAASDEAPTAARPWLFRVVRNLAIDERRSVARRADPVADTAILGTAALDDTASLVEQRQEIDAALRGIAALPPRQRKALEMDQAGIGTQAIATELGTTPNAVHQALFRARKHLRSGRAIAWGLIPIGLAPLALRLSDPALAVTITNLPPGAPIGRALPVAGIVAAVMVGGSAVAPTVDPTPRAVHALQFVQPAAASEDDTTKTRSVSANRGPSEKSGPSSNSGKGKSGTDDGDDDASDDSGKNRGQGGGGDDDDESGTNRRKTPGTAPSGSGGDEEEEDAAGSGSRRGKGSGSGTTTPSTPDDPTQVDDSPDAPDAPDDPSGANSGSGKG